jgi:hypothetical protein
MNEQAEITMAGVAKRFAQRRDAMEQRLVAAAL